MFSETDNQSEKTALTHLSAEFLPFASSKQLLDWQDQPDLEMDQVQRGIPFSEDLKLCSI